MKIITSILTFLLTTTTIFGQDTFSIVAVDEATGEIGSAGASCLDDNQFPGSGGAFIISDILPGRGAIHTQSFYLAGNQNNARLRMEAGDNPDEIITWLAINDVQGNNSQRQYGVVDFDDNGVGRAKAFTGLNCLDFKGQRVGSNYTIQGNILIDPAILDSMEVRFLNTTGTLAERLMSSLQGANVPGADSRCLNEGVSSLSAFVRVARPEDSEDNLYLDLNIPFTAFGVEPIDELQNLFDEWLLTSVNETEGITNTVQVFPNPATTMIEIDLGVVPPDDQTILNIYSVNGKLVKTERLIQSKTELEISELMENNMYFYRINKNEKTIANGKFIKLK